MKKKLLWLAVAAMLAVCAVVGAVIVSAAEPDPAASDTTEWTELASYTFDEGKADAGLTENGENFTYADGTVTLGAESYFTADVDLSFVDAISVTMRVKPTGRTAWPIEITSESTHIYPWEHYLGVFLNFNLTAERYANPADKGQRPGEVIVDDIGTDMVEIKVVWGVDNGTVVYVNGEEKGTFAQPAGYDLSIVNCIGGSPTVQIGKGNWNSGEYSDGLVIDSMSISVHKAELKTETVNGVDAYVNDDGELLVNAYNFPDETFRTYISDNFDTDTDGALSADELADVTAIDVGQMWTISSLKGVEYFAELTELDASSNNLAEIDVTYNEKLTHLNVETNSLTELDVTHNAKLTYLNVFGNSLTELDVSKNTDLEYLECGFNDLEELDVHQNTALTYLSSGSNKLTSLFLPASVKDLYIGYNHLTQLTVPEEFELDGDLIFNYNQTALESVTITKTAEGKYQVDMSGFVDDVSKIEDMVSAVTYERGKKISDGIFEFADDPLSIDYYYTVCDTVLLYVTVDTDMDEGAVKYLPIDAEHFPDANFRKYLKGLDVVEDPELGFTPRELNKVTEISCEDLNIKDFEGIELFPNLTFFSLWGNPLESLVMPECEKLKNVSVSFCDLKSLDVSKLKNLKTLYCYNNELTELDVSKLENLLYLDCSNNMLTELDLSQNTMLYSFRCDNNKLAYVDITNTDIIEAAENWYSGNFSAQDQTLDKKITVTDKNGTYTLALADVVGKADLSGVKVAVTNGTVKDGVITFTEKPTSLEYKIVYGKDAAGNELVLTAAASNIEIKAAETEPPVTETEPPETQAPETTETTPAETTAPSEPSVLEDKDESVTVEYPASEAESYSDVKLTVERNADTAKEVADSAFEGKYASYVPYEITLTKDGEPFAPVSSLTVNVPVPEGWDASKTAVYYVAAGSQPVDMNASASANGKYVTFTTTHFSTYVLVNTATAVSETTAPADTTAAPAETTAEPAETTVAPAETTAAPVETTASPVETTGAPAVTTEAPSTGSVAEPPTTGDGVGSLPALIVTMMCVGAAGIAVFTCSKKRR